MMEARRIPLDAETKVAERPHDHREELRLWLRLFTCKEVIESEVRRRLRDTFAITLPRFDLLAQLDRAPKGMTLGELSQRMMVTNGDWIGDMFADLTSDEIATLLRLLAKTKASARKAIGAAR